ncbi:hypothetical protein PYCCODRAFT_1448506 [Trametes coccinea BRFM310]|uniref:Uncharacterized protein n=1 Tax=Trametes coccinea (strain BRFM310) TaxID=1353009 RepID=A0A1Y2I7I6_TRAC3|nr:hypothetical protein PYCCODRAFT_1448506 [Trametes coccinea BRFM310]
MKATSLHTLSFAFFIVSLLSLCATLLHGWRSRERNSERLYTWRGDDYPHVWSLPELRKVFIAHEDSPHYSVETELGIAEWNATLPRGGALLYLGPECRPFTLSLFHQLKCLNIIRDTSIDLYRDVSPLENIAESKYPLVCHCMNYLRQTTMCRADLRLETVRAATGGQMTVSDISHTCKDWTAVYEAAEQNYRDYLAEAGVME